MSIDPPALRAVLEDGQRRGAIGPGSLDSAVAHAFDFFGALGSAPSGSVVDLGSGGGLPALPLALRYPGTMWTLVDAWAARVDALQAAVRVLGLGERATVVHARAEDLGRGSLRAAADFVVARGFGPPAWTAECAAPLLASGGLLVVSVAGDDDRWPEDGIPDVGLAADRRWVTPRGAFRSFRRVGPVSARYPRRPAAQRRQPLF